MRKIVVLDGLTLNAGDLDWSPLEKFGHLAVYDRTAPDALIERCDGAEILLTNKTVLDASALERLDALKFVSVLATGWNVVDTAAAKRRGIVVSNVPAYSTESVVESTFSHLLNLAAGLAVHTSAVRNGQWQRSPDFSFRLLPLTELWGKTLGIVGFGAIGRRVAAVALAFGMKTIAYGPHLTVGETIDKTLAVTLDALFAQSDAVTLHSPLTDRNRNMVDARRLALMKPTAFLINTARGPLIDENALFDALETGKIAGAGLDVLSQEPPSAKNRLFAAKNCFITPHTAWATLEARRRLMAVTEENLAAYCAGKPQNVVG